MLDDLNSRLTITDDVNVFQIYDGKLGQALKYENKKAIRFRSREEIVDYLGDTNLYPVVEKQDDDYLLVGVFGPLDDARAFIQGTRYIIWYKPRYP
jgi:hypothetical protein